MAKRGPKIKGPTDEKEFKRLESLLKMQCTLEECAMFFECDQKTLEKRVVEHYGIKFSELSAKKREYGKISIRRRQWKKGVVDGNVTMLIWLGKQYCGQKDKIDTGKDDTPTLDDRTEEEIEAEIQARLKRRERRNVRRSQGTA